jgi:hypothetical protein
MKLSVRYHLRRVVSIDPWRLLPKMTVKQRTEIGVVCALDLYPRRLLWVNLVVAQLPDDGVIRKITSAAQSQVFQSLMLPVVLLYLTGLSLTSARA